VYVLEPLSKEALIGLIDRALKEDEFLKGQKITIKDYDAMLLHSGGDARKLYNILELVTNNGKASESVTVTNEMVTKKLQQNISRYDKGGEQHYDVISAFIKSIRGSDPNGAVYWLARMIEGGEDVKFIARRLVISASEDIGLANPNALLMATTTFQAVQAVGLPEGRIILSQAAVYLASSPKSNSAYMAINQAQQLVRETGSLPIPLHLRNAPTKLMKDLDYGKNYKYSHDFPGNFTQQDFLPEDLKGKKLFEPQENPAEQKLKQQLKDWWGDWYGY
jgi:putative ATPase